MAYLQRSTAVVGAGTPAFAELTLPGTRAGSAIVVAISMSGSGTRTYTVSDTINGSYTQEVATNPGLGAWIFRRFGNVGGDMTISVNVNSGSNSFSAIAFECDDINTAATGITSSFSGSATTTHYCAAAGSVDTTTGTFVVTATALSGSSTTQTPNATMTEGIKPTGSSAQYFQVGYITTALTDQRGEWVQTGTARSGTSVIAAFPITGSGGGAATSGDWVCLL